MESAVIPLIFSPGGARGVGASVLLPLLGLRTGNTTPRLKFRHACATVKRIAVCGWTCFVNLRCKILVVKLNRFASLTAKRPRWRIEALLGEKKNK